ncbi:proline--tRNA ligase [Ureaplasma miroungigenitalium]|uniref:proline--tRNA ligase n=1 Tax=Ureaplasma miroungigenitalium TaxID=1042321 RepID=UPI0021E81F0A|nr:proline--tRNA ligase [Ureaplasma miroungigenitalium]MCV3734433.1 proline--tRNA ligase [Ureaplasma miroungigenitalium]
MKLERIVKRDEDFAQWYQSIVTNAKLAMYTNVKGAMIFLPNAWAIWESIRTTMDQVFKQYNVRNLAMPTLIPMSEFEKEKDHIEGFAPELYTITCIGNKVLDANYVVRPTSEILFCQYFTNAVNSYKDLPIKVNQWCSVMRAEKTTKPFLRNSEFHWQELHAVFADQPTCEQFASDIIDEYAAFAKEFLCIPVYKGQKTPWERFAGAEITHTIEAMMQDGQALQAGTSHYLGTLFAKTYNIKYQNNDNQQLYAHQMSAGVSTRLIGALIMVHADDQGLILPPPIAPVQIAIAVINHKEQQDKIDEQVALLKTQLNKYRVEIDDSNKGIGFKLAEQEIIGTPIVIIVGFKDLQNQQVTVYRRDDKTKHLVNLTDLITYVNSLYEEIKVNIYNKALARQQANTVHVNSVEELKKAIENKQMATCYFDGTEEDDKAIKALTNASTRCILELSDEMHECFYTKKKTNKLTLFARAY